MVSQLSFLTGYRLADLMGLMALWYFFIFFNGPYDLMGLFGFFIFSGLGASEILILKNMQ